MSEASVRELRDHAGLLLDRAAAGQPVTITRDGTPVARLEPVVGGRLSAAALVERFARLPPVDPWRLRRDVDVILDQRR